MYWLALAVTAGADIAAFNQIVSLVMRDQNEWIVALMVTGFTACSLTLAHFVGRLARDRTRVTLLIVPWAALGLGAFGVRLAEAFSPGPQLGLGVPLGGMSDHTRHATAAVMFLVLYAASGTVAGFGAYLTHDPVRAAYRRAVIAHDRALRRLSRSQPPYERAIQVLRQHVRSARREEAVFQAALAHRLANASELKRYAAVLIAAQVKDPSVTDGMTLPDRAPMAVPPPDPGPAPLPRHPAANAS